MFNWVWEILYSVSKTIFRIIDGLILCANKLCGIDAINFDGKENDLLSYLIFSDEVGFAFRVSAILATILLVIFSVFMIIRSIAKDKAEGTPAQIAIKAFKTILMFFVVPLVMVAFMTLGNAFITALYSATVQAASSPGAFLFSAFAIDGGMSAESAEMFRTGELDYNMTNVVSQHMVLADFPFIFSWIAGGVALFGIGSSMLIFVDRVLSLVILYIAAPISISTSVIDDGARFKLWRDQFLSKFIMGYGMILAINIYAMVCGLVTKPGFVFFAGTDSTTRFLDLIMKLLIIGGGALTMQKSMALVGNLVSQGAGSNELRDNAFSMGSLARMAKGAAGSVLSKAAFATGLKIPGSVLSDALAMKSRDWGSKILDAVGLGMGGNTSDKDGIKDPKGSSGARNDEKASYGSKDTAKNAINNEEGFKTSDWGKTNNTNNNDAGPKKNNMVDNAINGGGKEKKGENTNNSPNEQNQQKGENK